MPLTEYKKDLRRLRFPDDIEAAFQRDYFQGHRTHVCISLWVIALLMLCLFVAMLSIANHWLALVVAVPLLASGILLASLHRRSFVSSWQPLSLGVLLLSLSVFLFVIFVQTIYGVARTDNSLVDDSQTFGLLLPLFALATRWILGLQRRWVLPNFLAVAAIFLVWNYAITLPTAQFSGQTKTINSAPVRPPMAGADTPKTKDSSVVNPYREKEFSLSDQLFTLLMFTAPFFPFEWFMAGRSERRQRREFLEVFLLERERDEERGKREQTEAMLQVLGQAIGAIVHDLGNPLTSVQSGAEVLQYFVEKDQADAETIAEISKIILSGAQMLNYLRLSLMEQTRVLEGRPIPIQLAPASLRHIVQTGAQYQKPNFIAGRTIEMPDGDLEIVADEMKLVTVFMNLIGNALKYSEGPISVKWQTYGDVLLVGVVDRGKGGCGISRAQAQKLFVPFGRLDAHNNIEGTGLGLLSVRAIAQAHKGQIYIEGHESGTPDSPPFSTAISPYPSLLNQGDLTAFVLACPFLAGETEAPVALAPNSRELQVEVQK